MKEKSDYFIYEVKDPAEKMRQIEEMFKETGKKLLAKKAARKAEESPEAA